MVTTAFISMWITNTATTAMMTPIMEAVLKQLDKKYKKDENKDDEKQQLEDAENEEASASNGSANQKLIANNHNPSNKCTNHYYLSFAIKSV